MKYSELLKGVNPNWSVKHKARYLYWNLCKNIVYDPKFMYGKDPNTLESIYYRDVDIDKDEPPEFVCNSANKAYLQLLQRAGIKAKTIHKESAVKRPITVPDVALLFYDEEGNEYYTNVVGDIENCRYGLQTTYFGITSNNYPEAQNVKEIPREELKEIDIAVGNIRQDYSDIVFECIVAEVKNTSNFKKFLKSMGIDTRGMGRDDILKSKMTYITSLIRFRDRQASVDERKKFYRKLFFGSVLDKFESKTFEAYEFFKELPNGEIDSKSILELNLINRPVYYIFDENEQTYVQVDLEELPVSLDGYVERKGKVPLAMSNAIKPNAVQPKERNER